MNLFVIILLWVITVSCTILTFYSFVKTYKFILLKKRQRHLWKYANENRGRVGENQQWRCWECHTVMLSNFQVMVYENDVIAVCMRCSQSEKYNHIYNQAKGIKDSIVQCPV